MYYTGIDPFTKKPVYIAKQLKDRKLQRALLQFFKPENYFEVKEALRQANRMDLIGDGCDSLIPSKPPKEALTKRRQDANSNFPGNYVHQAPGSGARNEGSKPGRKPSTATVTLNGPTLIWRLVKSPGIEGVPARLTLKRERNRVR